VMSNHYVQHRQEQDRMRVVAFAFLTPFFFLKGGMSVSASALWANLGVLGLLFVGKMAPKLTGVYPLARRYTAPHAIFTTLLMSTGLTFGTISSLYGLNAGIINRTQFSLLSAIVVLTTSARGIQAVVYARDPGNVHVSTLRRDLLPLSLQVATGLSQAQLGKAMRVPITVRATNSKFGTAAQANDARLIAYLLLFLLYILIMINSQLIMSSVAEEKTSRIAELLVASVNPSALLSGKIAASATLAILQMIAWVAIGFALGAHPGAASPLDGGDSSRGATFSISNVSAGDIAAFAAFFLLGYLQTATMFAAVGSLVNRTEDLGSLAGPLVIPIVAAFIIAATALAAPATPAVIITSFIPLIAPFVMFARIVVNDVPVWQITLSLAINIAATYGIAVLAGKIYRVGMLLYGRPPKFSQIWSVIRS